MYNHHLRATGGRPKPAYFGTLELGRPYIGRPNVKALDLIQKPFIFVKSGCNVLRICKTFIISSIHHLKNCV